MATKFSTRVQRAGRLAVVMLASTLLVGSGCREKVVTPAPSLDVTRFDGARALAEVRDFIAMGPRESGTPAAHHAADYLVNRLHSLGVIAEAQPFQDAAPGNMTNFCNVVGRIPGSGLGLVILCAHFDTKSGIPGFIGANDSGSGVGVLLELARTLKSAWRQGPEIWLAFLDGEECRVAYGPQDGLHGSRRLAQQLVASGHAKEVRAVILLDMIGDRDLTVTLPPNGTPELTTLVLNAAQQIGAREKFSLAPGPILDDHQPFLDAGIPAVDLIDFLYGSAPGLNDYWHTAADTLDKLSSDSLQTIGRVVLKMLPAL